MKWDQFPIILLETHLFNRQTCSQQAGRGTWPFLCEGRGAWINLTEPFLVCPRKTQRSYIADSFPWRVAVKAALRTVLSCAVWGPSAWVPCPPGLQFNANPFGCSWKVGRSFTPSPTVWICWWVSAPSPSFWSFLIMYTHAHPGSKQSSEILSAYNSP